MNFQQHKEILEKMQKEYGDYVTNHIKVKGDAKIFHNVCVIKGALDLAIQKIGEIET